MRAYSMNFQDIARIGPYAHVRCEMN